MTGILDLMGMRLGGDLGGVDSDSDCQLAEVESIGASESGASSIGDLGFTREKKL